MNKKSPLIVCNWKMNPGSVSEAVKIVKNIISLIPGKKKDLVICPPEVYISAVGAQIKNKYLLGAQHVSSFELGAHTGEVGASMLRSVGVAYCIVGHSERRARGETNKDINLQIRGLLKEKIIPVLCVGEEVRDEKGLYHHFIREQIEECLNGIPKNKVETIVIAYEPVWAIGALAEREATAFESYEMSIFIRKIISLSYGKSSADKIKVLYGGSVNEKNAHEFLHAGGVDGFLLGRLSLEPKKLATLF